MTRPAVDETPDAPAATTRPVLARLTRLDGSSEVVATDARVLDRGAAVRFGGRLYRHVGDDAVPGTGWVRLYYEVRVVDLR